MDEETIFRKYIIENDYDNIIKIVDSQNFDFSMLPEYIYDAVEFSNEKIFLYLIVLYMNSGIDNLNNIDMEFLNFCAKKNKNEKISELSQKLNELIPEHEKPYLQKISKKENTEESRIFYDLIKEYTS